jgi:quercetin dioxygenase-like cupin family protein
LAADPGRPAITLLDFAPGFEDPNLCLNGHFIYVLEGSLELVMEAGRERLEVGEACFLDPGTGHRALNPGQEPARLIVVAL